MIDPRKTTAMGQRMILPISWNETSSKSCLTYRQVDVEARFVMEELVDNDIRTLLGCCLRSGNGFSSFSRHHMPARC